MNTHTLTKHQIHLLKLLYKFRFLTPQLLAQYQTITTVASNKSLNGLLEKGYVDRRYNKDYKLLGKGAVYYLAKNSLTYLRDVHKAHPLILHAMYKNRSVSDSFIDLSLTIVKVFITLRDTYPQQFHQYTKAELAGYMAMPHPLPDLYLQQIDKKLNKPSEYFLMYLTDPRLFVIKKQLNTVIAHYEEEGWEGEYPALLLVCASAPVEYRARVYLEHADIDTDLQVLTTTEKALLTPGGGSEVWTEINSDELKGI